MHPYNRTPFFPIHIQNGDQNIYDTDISKQCLLPHGPDLGYWTKVFISWIFFYIGIVHAFHLIF